MSLTEEAEGCMIKQARGGQNFAAMLEGYFFILSSGFQVIFTCTGVRWQNVNVYPV